MVRGCRSPPPPRGERWGKAPSPPQGAASGSPAIEEGREVEVARGFEPASEDLEGGMGS